MWAIRSFTTEDAANCAQLFYDAVHFGTQAHYTAAQRQAWAGKVPETGEWAKRLGGQTTVLAIKGQIISGFMTLDGKGYIDLAFVSPQYAGCGIGRYLYQSIEKRARQAKLARLHTQASRVAKPFFEKMGWTVISSHTNKRGSIELPNFQMEKHLLSIPLDRKSQ